FQAPAINAAGYVKASFISGDGGAITNLATANLVGSLQASNLVGALQASNLVGAVPAATLTSVPAGNLTGTLPTGVLPGSVITNTATGVTLTGTFTGTHAGAFAGNGSSLTNLNAATLGGTQFSTSAKGIELNTNLNVNAHLVLLRSSGDTNHGLAYSGSLPAFAASSPPDGPVLWGYAGGSLGYTSPTNGLALTWNNANVYVSAATAIGGNAQFNFYDRGGLATYGQWSYYAYLGRAYFWLSTVGNRMSIDSSGNVRAAGTFTASTTPDLAETIHAAANVEAGDIVCADPGQPESVIRGDRHSQGLLGVISDGSSGFIINSHAKSVDVGLNGKPLVLAGRVPVKVSMENGPIQIGDALAASSVRGVAMRADGSSPVIGIALSPYDAQHISIWGQAGKVLCFVKLGDATADTRINQLQQQNQQLEERVQKLENTLRALTDTLPTSSVP
ncbi:MAG TPA: hypothetical protein VF607_10295, partial [Verrucomicrobiae bacterium]